MIFCNDTAKFCNLKEIETALEYIRAHGASAETGKVELDGKALYISFQSYDTKAWEDCKYETHENYIDVQYVISGEEIITVTTREGLSERAPYNPEKDVTFYENDKRGVDLLLKAGDFVVVFPDDVHKPKAMNGKPCAVKKAVAKILIKK